MSIFVYINAAFKQTTINNILIYGINRLYEHVRLNCSIGATYLTFQNKTSINVVLYWNKKQKMDLIFVI